MEETTPVNSPGNRRRLKEIVGVLLRHDLVHGVTPEKLRLILEDLGPTFVKLGQIMSMRSDMLPLAYCTELTRLRTEVRPMTPEEVRAVLEEAFQSPLEETFRSLSPRPLGSASIAQAHAAVLRDGRRVVVKVQRPGIRDTMARDIALLRRAAGLIKLATGTGDVVDFRMVLDEMWAAAQEELDFLQEARHAIAFAQYNRDVAYIACPAVDQSLTTGTVLVMEDIDGIQIDDTEALKAAGYDLEEIGLKLVDNYVKQIIQDGYFHADPHPGNLRVREGKIVWLDFGMMGQLTARDQALFRQCVAAIAQNDVGAVKSAILTLGVHAGRINHAELYTDLDDLLTQYASLDVGSMDLGRIMEDVMGIANRHHIALPRGLTMLGRGVITMQGVLRSLDPDISLVEIMGNHLSGSLLEDFNLADELRHGGRALYGSLRKSIHLPAYLSDLLAMTIKGQTKVNWEWTGSEEPLRRVDKMVNKLVVSLLTAALFIASSLLCTTAMQPRILGIPLLGALGYLAALFLAGWLIFDLRRHRK